MDGCIAVLFLLIVLCNISSECSWIHKPDWSGNIILCRV